MQDKIYIILVLCLVASNLHMLLWILQFLFEYFTTRVRAPQLIPYFDEQGEYYFSGLPLRVSRQFFHVLHLKVN
jgi:hypothetical protein